MSCVLFTNSLRTVFSDHLGIHNQALHIHIARVIFTQDHLVFDHFCLWLLTSIHIPLLLQFQVDVYGEAVNNKHDSKESRYPL